MIRIGEIIDGRYEILKEIGRGGMSIVYLAMDNRLNKSIVVKEIRRRDNSNNKLLMDSLKQESDLLKNLDHAALPKIYDIIDRGDIYVVMDYIEGESLKRKLKREGKIQAKEVINYGIQLAKVLSYLHNRPTPIIYRDMKPDNVMLTPDGRIKLIDFGISKEYKVDTESDTTNLGTRAFAAPEQIAGLKTNARTDIYSLGVTLYNLVTGKSLNDPPFMLKPIREWDSSLPEGLEYIIKKCTETDPADRYENCDDLLYDLENVEKLTKAYKVTLIKEMSRFIVSSILLIFFIVITIIGYRGVSNENLTNYKEMINKSDSYLINGEYAKAIEVLDDVITKVDGKRSEAYINILNIYSSINDVDSGLSKIEGYINDKFDGVDKNDEVLFKVAMTYLDNKNYPIALKYFRMVNEKKIEDAKYYKTLATSLSSMNIDYEQFKEKLEEFEDYTYSLENNEKKVANYNSLAGIYISYKGFLEGANDKIISLVNNGSEILKSINDDSLNLRYETDFNIKLAQAYHSKGINESNKEIAAKFFDTAIDYYNEVLDSDGASREDTLIKIGEIYNDAGNPARAIEQLNTAIKNYPESKKAYIKLINILLDVEQYKGESARDYALCIDTYNTACGIEGIDNEQEFIKLKRRMANLGLI